MTRVALLSHASALKPRACRADLPRCRHQAEGETPVFPEPQALGTAYIQVLLNSPNEPVIYRQTDAWTPQTM